MKVTRDATQLPLAGRPDAVVSIGVFDGVHLGHQAILAANLRAARERGALPTVVTFTSHPKALLLGRAPRTLTTLDHRLEYFRRAGVGHTLALEFDERLRAVPAEDFTREVLIEGLGAVRFVLGFDSKFGRDRAGGPELLRSLGHGVDVIPEVLVGRRAVSSTAIREAVELGDLEGAARMLGRPVSIYGEVVRGEGVGRTLGFPTANLELHHELHPPIGVYAAQAHRVDSVEGGEVRASHAAAVNIGFRPSVEGVRPERPIVEAHLLDLDEDLYGEHLELVFVARLRGEQRFEGLDALRAQIALDVEAVRTLLPT